MMAPLINHCETHLGAILSGWTRDAAGGELPFQVVMFEKSPIPGVRVVCTLGLSDVSLRVGSSGTRRLRQELTAMFRDDEGPRNFPGILQQLASEAIDKDTAYAPGDVIGPRGELRSGATVSAIYTALPVYLPDSFQVCRLTPEPVVFAWMVPITDAEAAFIRSCGRSAFEAALAAADPDLLDTSRVSII